MASSTEVKDFYTIKTINKETGRVDIHKNLSKVEVSYLSSIPTIDIEIVEVKKKKVKS